MHHIVIGLAQQGFDCLNQLKHLCDDGLSKQQKPIFFHMGFSEKNIDAQGIEVISLPTKSRQDGSVATAVLIKKTLGAEQVEKVKTQIPVSRRAYAESFKKHGNILWKKLNPYCKDENVFHIITDFSACDATGVLFDILSGLSAHSDHIHINVYGLHPIDSLSEESRAQIYATLLECRAFARDNISFLMYPYKSKQAEQDTLITCAHHILNTVNVKVFGGFPKNAVPEQHIFAELKELTVSIDTQKMYVSMSRQNAIRITEKLFFAQSEEKFDLPECFNYLFDDKKWRLHDDFLHKEDNPDNPTSYKLNSIEKEWKDRANFCLKNIEESRESNWRKQIQNAYDLMQETYMQHFHGKGVGVFYAINENMIEKFAEQIVANLEPAVIYEWQGTYSSLTTLRDWIGEINAKIQERLAMYQKNRQAYEKQVKTHQQKYHSIIDEYDQTNDSKTQKSIQKKHSVQSIIDILEQYYVADCYVKSTNFGCGVLDYTIRKLAEQQNNINQCIVDAKNKFSGYLNHSSNKLSVQKHLDTAGEVEMQASVDTNLQSLMPKSFFDTETQLYPEMCENIILRIDSSRGIKAVLNEFDASILANEIAQILVSKHPFFLNKPEEMEKVLFWRSIADVLVAGKKELQNVLDKWQKEHHNEDIHYAYWIVPPCPFKQGVLDHTLEVCQNYAPTAQLVLNSEMTPYSIRYQEMTHLSLEKITDIAALKQAYRQVFLSENGAVYSLLMHTQNEMPFPEYEEFQSTSEPDKIRENLLLCELYGMIAERECNGNNEVILFTNNTEVVLGQSFPSIVENISSLNAYLLTHALNNTEIIRVTDEETITTVFNTRLEKIKNQCLNGKKDLKEASWQEAGSFMPWARKVDALLKKLK